MSLAISKNDSTSGKKTPDKYLDKSKKIIDKIASEGDVKNNDKLQKFVRQFFLHAPEDYLTSYEPKTLALIAKSFFSFIEKRAGNEPRKVRIYNANEKQDGFEAHRTFIEINLNDTPFLIDSISAEITRQNLKIYQVVHPVIDIKRDKTGAITDVFDKKSDGSSPESVMHFEVTYIESTDEKKKIEEAILNVLSYVKNAVDDWQAMLGKMKEAIDSFGTSKLPFKPEAVSESKDFLNWIYQNNFTFLGFVEYKFKKNGGGKFDLELVKNSELGVFKMQDNYFRPHGFDSMPKEAVQRSISNSNLVDITKSNRKSLVHRSVQMDYIGVKVFDKNGEVSGEKLFIGLFTSTVYYQSAAYIPIIRKKLETIVARSGFKPEGHNAKTLITVLETYPRDELLQISEDELLENCLEIVELQKRPRVKLFLRKDAFERFMSVLIFVPRERFNTSIRERIQAILQTELNGEVTDHYTQITDSPLARLHLIIKAKQTSSEPDIKAVEARVAETATSWHEGIRDMLVKRLGEKIGEKLSFKYSYAFPDSFINKYLFGSGVCDILKIEEALEKQSLTIEIYKHLKDDKDGFQLKIYHPYRQLTLSEILPVLENMGFVVIDEYSFLITPPQHKDGIWIHHFSLKDNSQKNDTLNLDTVKKPFEEAFLKIQKSEVENDTLNKLVIRTALSWRDVEIIRTYTKYMVQTAINYSHNFVADVLSKHSHITKLIVDLFHARFSLEKNKSKQQRDNECAQIISEIERELLDVTNVAEDRTLRGLSDIVMATLRTNFFQKDKTGNFKTYISVKLDSNKVPDLPLPKPFREIFVYSYRVEAIHLRGGKVARGGLRWSDRREDFRTEVLGLMKAQMVKNAVIVPVGSKGGFVVKHPPESRDEFLKEGIECYKKFLRGMLDITDNIVAGKIVPPENVFRHDDDDPYLVVAADKGTATFSDTANGVSAEYGFWLGDAFASGGSVGYDHKKMGITARGAWVSVRRHFREMGIDIDKTPFTVAGIGDMAGDVFGNGMLLSDNIKLIAAFNHQHIFIDPTPDATKTFVERKRMFELPRSSWMDYDQKLISKGGGIFERKSKSITLSKEAKKALSITDEKDTIQPDELIRAILKAPLDLLWNGGIGTYVKSSDESNESVGDRANDALRINGAEVGAKLVGEGGNLGFTQRGRIEYAIKGGRINTDAIDNSAGVDCSDHEVNIKIAFSNALSKKKLTVEERDKILANMTDEVGSLVLRDNVLQTQAITITELQGVSLLEQQARLMNRLEKSGLLKRKIEFLPDNEQIKDRFMHKQGLTRPEIAVLLAYSKIDLYNSLIASSLPDDPYFSNDLVLYFPIYMREKFKAEINDHQLRREIIATFVTNSMVNRVGLSFAGNLMEETGMKGCDVARAYTIVRDSYGLRPLWLEIEALEGKVPVKTIVDMFVQINNLIERSSAWLLRNSSHPLDVAGSVKKFSSGIENLKSRLEKIISPVNRETFDKRFKTLSDGGVPKELAEKISYLEPLSSAFDVVNVADKGKLGITVAGEIYFALSSRLSLSWLRESARRIASESHWQRLAVKTLINELYDQQTRIAGKVIESSCDENKCDLALKSWEEKNSKELERFDSFITDLKTNEFVDFSMLVIAVQKLQQIN